MRVLNKIMPLLMALVMSVSLSGCGNMAPNGSTGNEVCLPDGYTMEDLLNGFKINGKTLTYPITINGIFACDDRFTYELAPIYDDYKTPEEVFDYFHYPSVGFEILCDGQKLFQVVILKDDYFNYGADKSPINSLGYGFASVYFNECDVDLTYLDKIDFNSSYKDVVSCIGKPAYGDNNSNIFYKFKDNGVEYKLSFHPNNDEFINGKGEIVVIRFSIKEEDTEIISDTAPQVQTADTRSI